MAGSKIFSSLEEGQKAKKGFICGTWDLLHAGHVITLSLAKQNCEYLMVGLQSANYSKREPVQGLFERYIQLKACKFVDEIVPYSSENDLANLLRALSKDIDIRFLGDDYKNTTKKVTAADAVPIAYLPRRHDFSTTKIIQEIEMRHVKRL
jgi:glycerol-3-phosphate cytidylyltransferase